MEFNFDDLMKTINDEIIMRNELNALRKISAQRGKKITQEEVGNAIGCSGSTISRWLSGEKMLGVQLRLNMYAYLRKLEKELGVEHA